MKRDKCDICGKNLEYATSPTEYKNLIVIFVKIPLKLVFFVKMDIISAIRAIQKIQLI